MLDAYRTSQVAKIIGLPPHRIDRYIHSGLIKASIYDVGGSGSHRLFSMTDLLQLRVVKKLLDLGVSVQKIRRAKDFIDGELNKSLEGVVLFYDGRSIYACNSDNEIIDTLKHGQCILSIALGEMYEDLCLQLSKNNQAQKNNKIKEVRQAKNNKRELASSA